MANIIDGKLVSARLREEIKAEVSTLAAEGRAPGLAVILVGEDPASQVYVRNKEKALRVLRARLFDLEESKKQAERSAPRKNMVGSGDRSERIRTYNFPQNRITDHRINLTLYKLDQFMQGSLDEMIDALNITAKEAALKSTVVSN